MFQLEDIIPLIVNCSYEGISRRVCLRSVADISYRTLKKEVEDVFSLSAMRFTISYWFSEAREESIITNDHELHEAVEYFNLDRNAPMGTQSGRSSTEVGLEVDIVLELDFRLSDSGSLASSGSRAENHYHQASQNSLSSALEALALTGDGPGPGTTSPVAGVRDQQRRGLTLLGARASSGNGGGAPQLGPQSDRDSRAEESSDGGPITPYQTRTFGRATPARPGISLSRPPEDTITDCSKCHELLDKCRYVCFSCGLKTPLQHIPDEVTGGRVSHSAPSLGDTQQPAQSHTQVGYELCRTCLGTSGVDHAIEAAYLPGSLGHAYDEMFWEAGRWNIVRVERVAENCSFCQCKMFASPLRYKCAVCDSTEMCAGCHSQVRELHPNHPILVLNEIYTVPELEDVGDEGPPSHGVACIHCRLDIIGSRYCCLICKDLSFCSNCHYAGLLSSTDDGHIPSHPIIILTSPTDPSRLGDLFRRARDSSTRAALNIGFPSASPAGFGQRTVANRGHNHNMSCSACSMLIFGTRYQCGSCPSLPSGYNLCRDCEEKSYLVHDPNHIFLRFPRPVDQSLQSSVPLIRALYSVPAGPLPHVEQASPKDYLKNLLHSGVKCNRCMSHSDQIRGVWFRCAICPDTDLCDRCVEVDSHDVSHIFMVFKSVVDMAAFGNFARLGEPSGPRIIPYAVYY